MIQRREKIQREVTNEETIREEGRSNEETCRSDEDPRGLCIDTRLKMESVYTFKTSLSCFLWTNIRHKLMTNLAGNNFTPSPRVTNIN